MEATTLRQVVPAASATDVDWDVVFEQELPRVFNYFRYRLADRAAAEDLTSETFEKAWRARGRYRADRGNVSGWLFAIARNVAIDHYRRRRPLVPLDAAALLSDIPDPEDAALRGAERRRLATLLGALPSREQELIALKYGAQLTNREIARQTRLSESNVGTILHRTVSSLRARWHAEGGEP
jgi:RNA polymerase sigma-70 factor (ECF subfamily)